MNLISSIMIKLSPYATIADIIAGQLLRAVSEGGLSLLVAAKIAAHSNVHRKNCGMTITCLPRGCINNELK